MPNRYPIFIFSFNGMDGKHRHIDQKLQYSQGSAVKPVALVIMELEFKQWLPPVYVIFMPGA